MLVRVLAALLGLFHTINGLRMMLQPLAWFERTPGVIETGPFNAHFVMDVGFAFLGAGLAFFAFAWRPGFKLAALGASGFLVFHAALHVAGAASGHAHAPLVDIGAVAAPAFLGLALVWPRKEDF